MESESNSQQELIVNYIFNTKFTLPESAKLSDLIDKINKEFLMAGNDYEIYIKDLQLMIINKELNLKTLIENYSTNEFTVKAFKSKTFLFKQFILIYIDVFDLKQQLSELNDYLEYSINKEEKHNKYANELFDQLNNELLDI